MGTSRYKQLARKRAGIEGIPPTLRKRYNIDYLVVRELVPSKVWLGFKVSVINCKRLVKGLTNGSIPELSNFLYNHLLLIFSFQGTYTLKLTTYVKCFVLKHYFLLDNHKII